MSSRVRARIYSTPDLLADGTRLWSQLAKDWARAWTSVSETMEEVAREGLDAGLTPPGVPREVGRHAVSGLLAGGPVDPGGTVVPVVGIAETDQLVCSELVSIDAATPRLPSTDMRVSRRDADRRHARRPGADDEHDGAPRALRGQPGPAGRQPGGSRAPLRLTGHGGLTPVAALTTSAETRLDRLLERLLTAAETSLAAGDLEPARVTAEEVRAVDPDNKRAARILRHVARRSVGPSGERALMTVLFADLVGSTMLSERVEPEQLRDLFAFYRAAAREAVSRYSGSVVQYLGDGILAAFGYPEPHEDDARRAVLAGLDLGVAMRDAHAELDRRFGVAPEVRVGIHTGRVVVTDLSDDHSVVERDSIVGWSTNLAARIQSAAEPGMVVISDVTRQLVDADFYLQSLGERALKGISRPVEIFAVERPRYAAARFEVERYRKAGLVGRDEPRERLLDAWAVVRRTTDPAGAAFLLAGEAGIGKSRLVAEVLDRVEASGGRVLGVGCLPYYANVSLWPVARLLERELGVTADDPAPAGALAGRLTALGFDPARSLPFLGWLAGMPPTVEHPLPELDPSALLEETLVVLGEWICASNTSGTA